MGRVASITMSLFLVGCAWVSRAEYDDIWDPDGDGWGFEEDCSDGDGRIYPGAPDYRGDNCDADCGFAPDADGDDWPDDADCAPDDPDIYPCSLNEEEGDGIDSDCDGTDNAREIADCDPSDPDFDGAEPLENCTYDDDYVP